MYIFELINKVLEENRKKRAEAAQESESDTTDEKCEHIFSPVDSTGETLACSKCGLVVKKMKKNKINLFNHDTE